MDYRGYCKFQYGYDKCEGYSIIPNKIKEKPSTFYKYYALTDFNVDALTNMYVYASHPKQFNDPFDCNEKIIKFDTWDDVQCLWGYMFDKIKKLILL